MSFLKYRCPKNLEEVETSIETDSRTLKTMKSMKVSVWCPHCVSAHQIGAHEAYVDADSDIGLAGPRV